MSTYNNRLITVYVRSAGDGGGYRRLPECSDICARGEGEKPPIHISLLVDMPHDGRDFETDVLAIALRGATGHCDLQVDYYDEIDGVFQLVMSEYVTDWQPNVYKFGFLTPRLAVVELQGHWDKYYIVPMPRDMARYPMGGEA